MTHVHPATGLLVMVIVAIVLSMVSIILRVWSRVVVHRGAFGLDDYLAFLSLPFALAMLSVAVYACLNGLGTHADMLTAEQVTTILELFYVGATLFDLAIGFAKLSTLAFYVRVFGFSQCPSRMWRATFCFVFAATLVPTFGFPMLIFICDPIDKLWRPQLPGHCLQPNPLGLYGPIYNVVLDLMVLLLPMPPLWQLKMKRSRRLLIAATFVMGYSLPVMSIGRLVALTRVDLARDITYAAVPILYWDCAEPAFGLFVISLPANFQLFSRWRRFGKGALFSSRVFPSRVENAPISDATRGSGRWTFRRLDGSVSSATERGLETSSIPNVSDAVVDTGVVTATIDRTEAASPGLDRRKWTHCASAEPRWIASTEASNCKLDA